MGKDGIKVFQISTQLLEKYFYEISIVKIAITLIKDSFIKKSVMKTLHFQSKIVNHEAKMSPFVL